MTLVIVFNQLWNILNLLSEQNKINIPNTYKLVIYFAYFFSMKCFMVSSDLWEPVLMLQSLSFTSYGNQSWHDSHCPWLPMGTSLDMTVIVLDFLWEPVLTLQSLSLTSYRNQSWQVNHYPRLPVGNSLDITVIVSDFVQEPVLMLVIVPDFLWEPVLTLQSLSLTSYEQVGINFMYI